MEDSFCFPLSSLYLFIYSDILFFICIASADIHRQYFCFISSYYSIANVIDNGGGGDAATSASATTALLLLLLWLLLLLFVVFCCRRVYPHRHQFFLTHEIGVGSRADNFV